MQAGTRDDAKRALDQLALLLRTGLPGLHFVAVALSLLVLLAILAGAAAMAWFVIAAVWRWIHG